jgi:hypothetical protein
MGAMVPSGVLRGWVEVKGYSRVREVLRIARSPESVIVRGGEGE